MYGPAKRILDLGIGLLLVPACALVLPFMWISGRLAGLSGLFYYQDRVGRRGTLIRMIKFRTLEHDGQSVRTSGVLEAARRLGIDELPQLKHILSGEMSIVGPRPLLPESLHHVAEAGDTDARESLILRQSVQPGLTGVSQTLFRCRNRDGDAYWTMLNGDLWYAQRRSLALDLAVLLVTALYILSGGAVRFPARFVGENHAGTRHRREMDAPPLVPDDGRHRAVREEPLQVVRRERR